MLGKSGDQSNTWPEPSKALRLQAKTGRGRLEAVPTTNAPHPVTGGQGLLPVLGWPRRWSRRRRKSKGKLGFAPSLPAVTAFRAKGTSAPCEIPHPTHIWFSLSPFGSNRPTSCYRL